MSKERKNKVAGPAVLLSLIVAGGGLFYFKDDIDWNAASNAITSVFDKQDATTADNNEVLNKPTTDGGGNEFNNPSDMKVTEVSITVSKSEYFYNGTPLTMDEIVTELGKINGEALVTITDSNAAYNAYLALTDKLTELGVKYTEEKNE